MCEALVVSRSGFFASFKRPQCERARGDVVLGRIVRGSFGRSDRTYGARWVWHDVLAEGLSYGLHRVAHPIRASAFKVRPRRRRLLNDAGWRSIIAGNVLGRQFAAEGPNRRRVADFTCDWTAEGWHYVAIVRDLFRGASSAGRLARP